MKFCPECKSVIIPRTVKNETLLLCNQCGWYEIHKGKVSLIENEKIEKAPEQGEGVASSEDNSEGFINKCPECGYDKAEVQDLGVQYSDEDTLILVKCCKCGHVERIGQAS